jgi:hypothetical protein
MTPSQRSLARGDGDSQLAGHFVSIRYATLSLTIGSTTLDVWSFHVSYDLILLSDVALRVWQQTYRGRTDTRSTRSTSSRWQLAEIVDRTVQRQTGRHLFRQCQRRLLWQWQWQVVSHAR